MRRIVFALGVTAALGLGLALAQQPGPLSPADFPPTDPPGSPSFGPISPAAAAPPAVQPAVADAPPAVVQPPPVSYTPMAPYHPSAPPTAFGRPAPVVPAAAFGQPGPAGQPPAVLPPVQPPAVLPPVQQRPTALPPVPPPAAARQPAVLPPPILYSQPIAPPSIAPPPPPPPPPVPPPPPAPPASVRYAPGEGLGVSLLDGTSTLKLFGQFSTIGSFNTTRGFPAGGPLFLVTPDSGSATNSFDVNARQTMLGAAFSGPDLFGFTPSATLVALLQDDNLTSDRYGVMPYNAFAELRNDQWRFAAGLMPDVFNPANPTTISLLRLFDSGNTGSFAGAVRAEHFYKPDAALQLTTQFAVRKPVASVVTSNDRFVEDNGWPNIEARLAAGVGEVQQLAGGRATRPVEVGVSGVVGQLRSGGVFLPVDAFGFGRTLIDVWGVGVDSQVALTDRCGFVGEFYAGQGLGEYNGGIGQSFGDSLRAVRSVGGFGEVYYYLTDAVHLHVGYGIDSPLRRDLSPGQLRRNQTYFTNLIWDASKTMQFSFEVDYRKTDYVGLCDARGVVFLGQFLLRF